jgi:hypothetical protein
LVLTVRDSLIRNVLGQKQVLGNYVVDLTFDWLAELVVPHIDIDNVGIALKCVLKGAGIGVIDEVAGDVERFDGAIELQEFGEGLAEHVAQAVGGEGQALKEGVVVEQVRAQF